MNINIPIYVEAHREQNPRRTVYQCEPLFSPDLHGRDESLSKAMGKLMRRLKPRLDSLAGAARHDDLANFVFNPDCDTQTLKLSLDLRDRIVKCKLMFVEMKMLDRRLAFSPSLRELWFELDQGESLHDRATEILSRHFRRAAKMDRESGSELPIPSLDGQAWVTVLDVPFKGGRATHKEQLDKFASLFEDSQIHGATELDHVGRCLDWLYPDELNRAALRKKESAELNRLLGGIDRRPVLLVGPNAVGKTTLMHEFVFRRVQQRKQPYSARKNVWLLSPQRLVSGMSYVGQWENRVLAILNEARRRDHVLYFDDVMGLYQAGISADSRLCVADVLRSSVLRREVRIVGEMTTTAFAAFQERDRGLADQFHVLPIYPTNDADTLRILLQVRRQLEGDTGCQFASNAVPAVLDLTRRYEGEDAFPGKAAGLLRHLSALHPNAEIDRGLVYREFHAKTGLSLPLLDTSHRLTREAIVGGLRQEIVGQAEAINAAADVITVAKAGLNDPQRPIATLLFLGPTGVGKTQCAKTLTKVLFTDESRLLRFDMNEFVSPDSAARLVGTASDPEGLLTAAVRRQPYSVVLFDEIEKAHPDVFDLLLQLTGEGRLTDALGRTSNFCNTVVVMTSNLGVRESGRSVGWRSDEAGRRQVFVKAAEDFFRPEFFNRIDRVIPFDALGREDMQRIAELLLGDLLGREGLVRRQCVLQVDKRAMRRIVDEGYHPQLGARALKRAIEKQLTHPIAMHLTAVSATAPAVIDVYCGPAAVLADVNVLKPVDSVGQEGDDEPAAIVERSERLLGWLAEKLEAGRASTDVQADQISPEQLRYFALKEQAHVVRELVASLKRQLKEGRHRAVRPEIGVPVRDVSHQEMAMLQWSDTNPSRKRFMREIQAAEDINDFLRESAAIAATPFSEFQQLVIELRRQAGWLWEMWRARGKPERVVLVVRDPQPESARSGTIRMNDTYAKLFGTELSFEQVTIECSDPGLSALYLAGPFIWPLAKLEEGVHLLRSPQGNAKVLQVSVLPIEDGEDAETTLQRHVRGREDWLDALATGKSSLADNPWPVGRLVRISGRETRDLRSGLRIQNTTTAREWVDFLFAGFAPPASLEDVE